MALMRWEPFGEVETMRRQMDMLLGRMLGGRAGLPSMEGMSAFMPNIEVYTKDQEVVVKAEIPGIEPGDIHVEVTEEAVHLSGELKKETEVDEDNYHRSERQYGHFERVIPLPSRIKEQEAKAGFKNGLLTIRMPLAEEVRKPRGTSLKIEQE